jgi:hypothetical protein
MELEGIPSATTASAKEWSWKSFMSSHEGMELEGAELLEIRALRGGLKRMELEGQQHS